MTDVEWQIRNWLYFTWLSGDHICEQHVHNLDVINWAMRAHPVSCVGMGGRQVRTEAQFGHIFDHFAVDYQYPNDVHMLTPADKQLQDVLVSIRERGSLDEAATQGFLAPNAERFLKTRAEMEEALLGPGGQRTPIALEPWLRRAYLESLDMTVEVAGRCGFQLDFRSKRFPGFRVPPGETPFSYLYQLCQEGAKQRYRPMTAAVSRRLV